MIKKQHAHYSQIVKYLIGTPGFRILNQHMGSRNKLFKIPHPFLSD